MRARPRQREFNTDQLANSVDVFAKFVCLCVKCLSSCKCEVASIRESQYSNALRILTTVYRLTNAANHRRDIISGTVKQSVLNLSSRILKLVALTCASPVDEGLEPR